MSELNEAITHRRRRRFDKLAALRNVDKSNNIAEQ